MSTSDMLHTLLIRLAGPMQSWGTQSRFAIREAGTEPSKSGVIGLIAAAMGLERDADISALARLRFGVRVDHEGVPGRDYHTAGAPVLTRTYRELMLNKKAKRVGYYRAGGSIESNNPKLSERFYLADACFTAGLEAKGDSGYELLYRVYTALRDPCWPLYLGRRAFPPTLPVALPHEIALQSKSLLLSLLDAPFPPGLEIPERIRLVVPMEVEGASDGQQRLAGPDQPQSFDSREYASRTVAVLYRTLDAARV